MRVYTQLLSECMNEYGDELFNFEYDMPVAYRPIFELKFLLRNGQRNIGFESYPLFKQMLRSSLMELMPKYLKLYESAETPFNPFINNLVDITDFRRNRARNKGYATNNAKSIGYSNSSSGSMGNSERGLTGGDASFGVNTGLGNTKSKGINDAGSAKISLFSDTPQSKDEGTGGEGENESSKYFNDGYITTKNYDKDSSTAINASNQDTFNRVADEKTSEMYQNASEYSNSLSQANGINRGQSYADTESVMSQENTSKYQYSEQSLRGVQTSDIIKNWRSTFINVDAMLLDELDELFMQVY